MVHVVVRGRPQGNPYPHPRSQTNPVCWAYVLLHPFRSPLEGGDHEKRSEMGASGAHRHCRRCRARACPSDADHRRQRRARLVGRCAARRSSWLAGSPSAAAAPSLDAGAPGCRARRAWRSPRRRRNGRGGSSYPGAPVRGRTDGKPRAQRVARRSRRASGSPTLGFPVAVDPRGHWLTPRTCRRPRERGQRRLRLGHRDPRDGWLRDHRPAALLRSRRKGWRSLPTTPGHQAYHNRVDESRPRLPGRGDHRLVVPSADLTRPRLAVVGDRLAGRTAVEHRASGLPITHLGHDGHRRASLPEDGVLAACVGEQPHHFLRHVHHGRVRDNQEVGAENRLRRNHRPHSGLPIQIAPRAAAVVHAASGDSRSEPRVRGDPLVPDAVSALRQDLTQCGGVEGQMERGGRTR